MCYTAVQVEGSTEAIAAEGEGCGSPQPGRMDSWTEESG